MVDVGAQVYLTIGPDGTWYEQLDPTTLWNPRSVTKVMTAVVARHHLPDGDLDDTVTYTDNIGGSTAELQEGDIISYRDLFYGMALPSGNDAARCMGRNIGQLILDGEGNPGGDAPARFVTAMNDYATNVLGWADATFGDPAGIMTGNAVSMQQWAELFTDLQTSDPWLIEVAGTESYEMTATGPNARTWTITHTIRKSGMSVPFPELVAGKSGSGAGTAGAVVLWTNPVDEGVYCTAFHGSTEPGRWGDLRTLMDARIDDTPGPTPPDPPGIYMRKGGQIVPASMRMVRGNAYVPIGGT